MKVALGGDHGGFLLKKSVIDAVISSGNKVLDLGAFDETPVDPPDLTRQLQMRSLLARPCESYTMRQRCGSSVGANKISGIRAGRSLP